MESVQLTTSDGHVLAADIAEPGDAAPAGSVAICHPHPQYGGNRFNTVVEALFTALPEAGFRALRFDFRSGAGDAIAERLDLIAALDELEARAVGPFFVAGYSFGAAVALGTADDRIAALAAIAPPLTLLAAGAPPVPTLVLTPSHDQFCPPDAAAAIVSAWDLAELEIIESADHFLQGHTQAVADRATSWLVTQARAAAR